MFSVSVVSKGLSVYVSGLESTLAGTPVSVDSKRTYVAPKLSKMAFFWLSISVSGFRRETGD
jgi:hypothetical protein